MLEQLLTHLHNWFRMRDDVDGKHPGTYTIEGGGITLPFLQTGQYYRILGSVFNNGLHKYGDGTPLRDETFDGTVWALAVPDAVVLLADEIKAWVDRYGEAVNSPFASESFAGYSYSKRSGGSSGEDADAAGGWQTAFRWRLEPWRKLRED